jgi:electron transport complex protein RnfC
MRTPTRRKDLKSLTFKGGVHPKKMKELTKEVRIRELPPPKVVVIPLLQHVGAPCSPKVKIKEKVKVGQVIGESEAFVSAPVHATLSGKVTGIEKRPHPVAGEFTSIIIESDGEDEWFEQPLMRDYTHLTAEEMRGIIRSAGIVGLGGAAFPTHVKLTPPKGKNIDTVIINGGECEPYLTADYRTMLENAKEIVTGLKIIMKILATETGYIAIEDDKVEAIHLLEREVAGEPNIKVQPLKAKYPQGAEKQLIKAILNREVPSGGLPFDVGVVVQNVGTTVAIAQAVLYGRPLISRVLTVSGGGIANPQNVRVRIGTLFKDVINECGGLRGSPGKIIMGGPMMGLSQATLSVPVVKGTSGILVFSQDEVKLHKPKSCIKCGKCIRTCPMRLIPSIFSTLAEYENFLEAERAGVLDCIECGCCAYVCPSRRPLIHLIKFAKAEIAALKSAS